MAVLVLRHRGGDSPGAWLSLLLVGADFCCRRWTDWKAGSLYCPARRFHLAAWLWRAACSLRLCLPRDPLAAAE
jgi:hypothetical protein